MGGCVSGGQDPNDIHPNIFLVDIMNNDNKKIGCGKLEVTQTHIIMHQSGQSPTKWSLKSLRRYGAHNDVFCFEAGRQCESGAGIYLFRCQKATQLMKLLQDQIKETSEHRANELASRGPNSNGTASTASEITRTPPMVSSPNGEAAPPIQKRVSSLPTSRNCNYANVDYNGQPVVVQGADGYLVPNPSPFAVGGGTGVPGGPDYENVTVPDRGNKTSISSSILGGASQPLRPPKSIGLSHDPGAGAASAGAGVGSGSGAGPHQYQPPVPQQQPAGEEADESKEAVNYIPVEIIPLSANGVTILTSPGYNGGCPSQTFTPGSDTRCLSSMHSPKSEDGDPRGEYTQIDFDRTQALRDTAKQQSHRAMALERDNDEEGGASTSPVGARKTRHNSTLSELTLGISSLGGKRNSVIAD